MLESPCPCCGEGSPFSGVVGVGSDEAADTADPASEPDTGPEPAEVPLLGELMDISLDLRSGDNDWFLCLAKWSLQSSLRDKISRRADGRVNSPNKQLYLHLPGAVTKTLGIRKIWVRCSALIWMFTCGLGPGAEWSPSCCDCGTDSPNCGDGGLDSV